MSRRESQRSTIYDVASRAGVSHQTVSRLLKGSSVKEATRERVEAAIAELDYHPNLTARSLATNRSHRIGALVSELLESGPSKVLQGASRAARQAGYLLDIVSLDPADPVSLRQALVLLDQNDYAAIVAITPTEMVHRALLDEHFSVPLLVDRQLPEDPRDCLSTVNGSGVRLAIEHLVAIGHRNIAYVSGPSDWHVSQSATAAYRTTLEGLGLPVHDPVVGDWSSRSGHAAVDLLPWGERFTAIVSGNDQMALGLLSGLDRRGVRVPDDVSVVGFDDIPEAAYLRPPLTTLAVDFDAQGTHLVDDVLRLVAGEPFDLRPLLQPTLAVRGSTAPPPPQEPL